MTNKEWLESLTKEELVSWLLDEEVYIENRFLQPSPKLRTLKFMSTCSREVISKWLDEERKEQ